MTYTEPDLADLHTTMAVCARPRYAAMTDPHDNNTLPGEPAIRFISYMGDYDSYFETCLVGPYPNEQARNADLQRLCGLPLGASEFNGGYEFLPSTTGAAEVDPDAHLVAPEQVAPADTVRAFFGAFYGWDSESESVDDPYAPHPDQSSLITVERK